MTYYYKITPKGEKWVLVLRHSMSGGFFESTECMYSTDKNRYSVMRDLPSLIAKHNNRYEFMIEYDDDEFFRWTQDVLPTSRTKSSNFNVDVKFVENNYNFTNFTGLLKSSDSRSCFDGQKGGGYWFSVGTIQYGDKIPGKIKIVNESVKYLTVNGLSLLARAKYNVISCQRKRRCINSLLSYMIALLT